MLDKISTSMEKSLRLIICCKVLPATFSSHFSFLRYKNFQKVITDILLITPVSSVLLFLE